MSSDVSNPHKRLIEGLRLEAKSKEAFRANKACADWQEMAGGK